MLCVFRLPNHRYPPYGEISPEVMGVIFFTFVLQFVINYDNDAFIFTRIFLYYSILYIILVYARYYIILAE